MKHLLLIAVICVLSRTGAGQEWTRFRGPNGTGIGKALGLPEKIDASVVAWKTELSGSGHSSPVLWGDKLFLTSTGDKAGGLAVLCFDARDGHQLWRREFPLKPFARHEFNSFASATPAVDSERVYVSWNEPDHYFLAALDHGGQTVWQRDLGPFVSQHGCGISPIVYQGRVILGNEQDDTKFVKEHPQSGRSFIVAVEAVSGKTLWQTPRNSAVVAYSTPCVYEPKGGKASLIFNSQGHGIYAADPETGKIVWEFDQAFDKRSVSSPLVAGDVIIGSCGSGGGGNFVTAIRAGNPAMGRKPELLYQMKRSAPYVPTGIVRGDLAWLWSDSGILTCLEAQTGNIRYQERVGGDFFGSPVLVGERMFCVSTTGDLVVAAASEQFKILDRFALKELCHSTPAVARGHLFVRTEKHLWSFGEKKSK